MKKATLTCEMDRLIDSMIDETPDQLPPGAPEDTEPCCTMMVNLKDSGTPIVGPVRRHPKLALYVVTVAVGDQKKGIIGMAEVTFDPKDVVSVLRQIHKAEESRIVQASGPLPPGLTRR